MNSTDLAVEKLLNDIALHRLNYHINGVSMCSTYTKDDIYDDFECTGDCRDCLERCEYCNPMNVASITFGRKSR